MAKALHEFFAVTISDQSRTAYRVTYEETIDRLVVEVIALRGRSGTTVGSELYGGNLVGITRQGLQLYGDDGSHVHVDQNGRPRRPEAEEIKKGFWGDGTNPLVALFLIREDAEKCFREKNLQRCDPRWHKDTKEVLAAIGQNHRTFVVSSGVLRLPIEW